MGINFNTSYVVIKQSLIKKYLSTIKNFNTSYVVIKQVEWESVTICIKYFNTSYVVIKRITVNNLSTARKISIHLMLLLNSS